jgi:hypothetical protein
LPLLPEIAHELVRVAMSLSAKGETMFVKIIPGSVGGPAGKLADAELYFDEGLLSGLKLVGFTVWDRRETRGRSVTFPARQYSVNGERRHYVLLRATDETKTTEPIRQLILKAYAEYEERSGDTAETG